MNRTLISLLKGIGAAIAVAPIATLSGWLYITQGHWNPGYIIASVIVSDLLVGIAVFRLSWEHARYKHG